MIDPRWQELCIESTGVAQESTLEVVDGKVDEIKLKTDLIPATPASVGSAMTLTAAYDAAKTPLQSSDISVSSADSANNVDVVDVIGNKSDTFMGTSVVALVKQNAVAISNINTLPIADAVTNSIIRDVIGNKSDTTSGTSIVALLKQAIAKIIGAAGIAVPTKNSTDNVDIVDVIGNKTDDENGDSIYSKLYTLSDHAHGVQLCKPTLAGGITVTAAAGAWALSAAYTVLFATNEVNAPFDIHQIHVGTFTGNDIFQLELYSGANGAEVLAAQVRFSRTNATNPGSILPCITPLFPANTQIKAKLASAAGSSSCNFSVMYHKY